MHFAPEATKDATKSLTGVPGGNFSFRYFCAAALAVLI
jgi:hypothetical protein